MPLRTTFATPSLSSRFYFFSFDICKYKQTPQALMAYSEKKMFSGMSNNSCAMAEGMTSCSSETPLKKIPVNVSPLEFGYL